MTIRRSPDDVWIHATYVTDKGRKKEWYPDFATEDQGIIARTIDGKCVYIKPFVTQVCGWTKADFEGGLD